MKRVFGWAAGSPERKGLSMCTADSPPSSGSHVEVIQGPDRTDHRERRELPIQAQSVFADVLGVSKKTVEAWESGRNVPSDAACRLLELIGNDKALLERNKIVVYNSPTTKVRPTEAGTIRTRAPKTQVSKSRSPKAAHAR